MQSFNRRKIGAWKMHIQMSQCNNYQELCFSTASLFNLLSHTIHSMSNLACLTAICQPGLCPGKQTCTVVEGEAVCSCKCSGSGCNNAGTVCGSNGQSYDSQAALILAACRSGKDIDLDYYGECQGGYYCNQSVEQILQCVDLSVEGMPHALIIIKHIFIRRMNALLTNVFAWFLLNLSSMAIYFTLLAIL